MRRSIGGGTARAAGRPRRPSVWRLVMALTAAAATAVSSFPGGAPALGSPDRSTAQEAPGPAAVVTPAADLVDGDTVTVDVSGMTAGAWVGVAQCPVGAELERCNLSTMAYGEADAEGAAQFEIIVSAAFVTDTGPGPAETDCRSPGACDVAVVDFGGGDIGAAVRAPLHFSAGSPLLPPPDAAAAPADGLVDGQSVEVTGNGFVLSTSAVIHQCVAPVTGLDSCDRSTARDVTVADDGTLAIDHTVVAIVDTAGGPVDCREAAGRCSLTIAPPETLVDQRRRAEVPLTFVPDGEVIEAPELPVAPSTGLVDGQAVEVSATDLPPGSWLDVRQCSAPLAWDSCTPVGGLWADEEGVAAGRITVVAVLDDGTDCRTVAEPCQLVAAVDDRFSPSRSPRAALHFDPTGPLAPTPAIAVTPRDALADGSEVTVTGTNFRVGQDVWIQLCTSADANRMCADDMSGSAMPDETGAIEATLAVYGTFTGWDGAAIDCRVAPGCTVVATQYGPRTVTASQAVTFGPPAPSRGRYLGPVFDEVEIERDIVYRTTENVDGDTVDLALDIYQPAGDTAARRPVIVFMHGGYFVFGDKADIYGYGEDYARMGYVVVSVQYRLRPDMGLWPDVDLEEFFAAGVDGYDDAAAAVAWLEDHAADYRIDPDAIIASGYSAGATNALHLAWLHNVDRFERPEIPGIAAAAPVAGAPFGLPGPGDVPVIQFHGDADSTVDFNLAANPCRSAPDLGAECELVVYEGAGHEIISTKRRDIQRRTADFVATEVLAPLGYDVGQTPGGPGPDPDPDPDPGGPAPGGPTTTPTTVAAPPASRGPAPIVPADDDGAIGSLARTGAALVLPLAATGALLVLCGAGFRAWSRRRA